MRYGINIFCGKVFCGNGFFDTLAECMNLLESDGFCDRAKIVDNKTGNEYNIKVNFAESKEVKK